MNLVPYSQIIARSPHHYLLSGRIEKRALKGTVFLCHPVYLEIERAGSLGSASKDTVRIHG